MMEKTAFALPYVLVALVIIVLIGIFWDKRDLKERFLKFETFNGAFVYVPWGLGFVYCGLYDLKLGYQYAFVSVGLVLIFWGLRKAFVNRVKQAAKEAVMVEERVEQIKEKQRVS